MRAARTLVLLLALSGCGDDGRTLAPAPPVTTTASTAVVSVAPSIAGPMRISSVDVGNGGTFPRDVTCDGGNRAPTFAVTGVPATAAELAVAVLDVTADGVVNWVVAGLPPDIGVIEPSDLPAGTVQARSSSGAVGWAGPCPPPGDPAHRYEVRAYALPEPVGLAAGADGPLAVEVLEEAAAARAVLSATYRRGG